jgi:hypothetical protein
MSTTTDTKPQPTPGYSYRIAIWFATTKRGQKTAYYWSFLAMRAIRVPLADAEIWAATDAADVIAGHPFKPEN